MDKYYAILYYRYKLDDCSYEYQYFPYSVVELDGSDDASTYLEMDDFSNTSDGCVCIGRRYSKDDLFKKHGEMENDDLLLTFFRSKSCIRTFGKKDDDKFIIDELKDYDFGYSEDEKFVLIDPVYFENPEFRGTSLEKYKNQKIDLGYNFIILNRDDYNELLYLYSLDKIYYYLRYKISDVSTYYESDDCYIFSFDDLMKSMNNLDDFYKLINSKFDKNKNGNDSDNSTKLEKLHNMIRIFKCNFDINISDAENCDDIDTIQSLASKTLCSLEDVIVSYQNECEDYSEDYEMLEQYANMFGEILAFDIEDLNDFKLKFNTIYSSFLKDFDEILKKDDKSDRKIEDISVDELNKLIDDTLMEFDKLVGLSNVKEEVSKILSTVLFSIKMKDYVDLDGLNKHLVFLGNPGTGKTTVTKLLAPILYKIGYLKSDKVAFVAAQDLIAEYVGQTAVKTDELIKKNKGGIIVLDEAYILANGCRDGNDFGNEAIAVILKEMEKNDTMFIFCGYKKEMESFLEMNSGLKSRIGNYLEFKDYTVSELYEMFLRKLSSCSKNNEYKFKLDADADSVITDIFNFAVKQNDFGNGRFVDNLFTAIIREHAINTRSVTDLDRLLTITLDDINEKIIDSLFYKKENKSVIGFNSSSEVDSISDDIRKKRLKIIRFRDIMGSN